MIQAGDVVIVEFPGVSATKRRPAIVVSSALYHQSRPDVILCLLTSQVQAANAPTDYLLQDWSQAGLRQPSAARMFLVTVPAADVSVIGRLSERDWREVQARLQTALAIDYPSIQET